MEWVPGREWPQADLDVARAWANSGAQWLTTRGVRVPGRMIAGLAGLVRQLDQRGAGLADQHGAAGVGVLSNRAAMLGLPCSGRASCGGVTRLVRAADDWIALALARPDDVCALPAWLGIEPYEPFLDGADGSWPLVAERVSLRPASEIVEFGAMLGLACSVVSETAPGEGESPVLMARLGEALSRPLRGLRVVSLASLWAGPLCADVLRRLGADVVSVESLGRPDGARATPNWFAALHVGQRSVALDFRCERGVADLADLLRSADVVIEGSRPRALEQIGIDAVELVGVGPQVWLSITGHGRRPPGSARVAFGDDAAAAGGLVGRLDDGPVFLADAVADPLTGLTAAVSIVDLLERGGRWIVDLALSRVAACAASRPDDPFVDARTDLRPPQAMFDDVVPVALGHDTGRVLAEWGSR